MESLKSLVKDQESNKSDPQILEQRGDSERSLKIQSVKSQDGQQDQDVGMSEELIG